MYEQEQAQLKAAYQQEQAENSQSQCNSIPQTSGYVQHGGRILGTALDSIPQVSRSTPQEESHRSFLHHSEQAQRAGEAAKFLSLHPEFSRFIELIRSGAISI